MKRLLFGMIAFLFMMGDCMASENVLESSKYYKTDKTNNGFIIHEITEKEYNNVSDIELYNAETNTEYKNMRIKLNNNKIVLTVSWKKTPKYKSYDVISISGDGVSFSLSGIKARQCSDLNDDNTCVFYNSSSKNVKLFSNGIGISMNLMDNVSIHYIQYILYVTKTSSHGIIYGNYRHARKNVTLSESQNYTLNNGNINFIQSLDGYYDRMNSVTISY